MLTLAVKITGEVRRGVFRGFGPFKKKVWDSKEFQFEIKPGSSHEVDERLGFSVAEVQDGLVVSGFIESIPCLFGEIRFSNGETKCSFQMSIVADVRVNGTVEILDTQDQLGFINRSSAA